MSGQQLPMTADEQSRRAEALLNDPLLMYAFRELLEGAMVTWRHGSNTAQREEQWHKVNAIQALQVDLAQRLRDPKLAARLETRWQNQVWRPA